MAYDPNSRVHPIFQQVPTQPKKNTECVREPNRRVSPQGSPGFPGALLQRLMPRDFDDGDLLILLILLLTMKEENRDPVSMIAAALIYFSSGGEET